MSEDLKMELAKNEYVEAINQINQKYQLSASIIEILLSGIFNEVHNMKIVQIQKEKEKLSMQNKESEK